jgi:hypothetical protein
MVESIGWPTQTEVRREVQTGIARSNRSEEMDSPRGGDGRREWSGCAELRRC